MKLKITLILALMLGFPLALRAAPPGVNLLDDRQMAAIKGGFCPFEVCEPAPGTGTCQSMPPAALCTTAKCIYNTEQVGGVEAFGCIIIGKTTCSNIANYRQCVFHLGLSYCSYGATGPCGTNLEPHCTLNIQQRNCTCSVIDDETPCDWANCLDN